MPIEEIAPTDADLFRDDTLWPYFERLRAEDPVHCNIDEKNCREWSITKYDDILFVDGHADLFAPKTATTPSEDPLVNYKRAALIASNPPQHTARRKAVGPIFGPHHLDRFAPAIRRRVADLLDGLPVGEEFDWVERVSAELTNIVFVTLFGLPWEDRHKLIHWHNVALTPDPDIGMALGSDDQRRAELTACADYFFRLWDRRAGEPAADDLISSLAHGLSTSDMDRTDYMGHILNLILGGTHAMRSAISGSVLALSENPAERQKLRANPELVPAMISESLRWQTPLGFIHRTARRDCELRGKTIAAGERVLMWYVSGNRDEDVIEAPDRFDIERENPRKHLSYGFGIHRCLGSRLSELQMQIAWEEILSRSMKIDVVGVPLRFRSCFVRDFHRLPVKVTIAR